MSRQQIRVNHRPRDGWLFAGAVGVSSALSIVAAVELHAAFGLDAYLPTESQASGLLLAASLIGILLAWTAVCALTSRAIAAAWLLRTRAIERNEVVAILKGRAPESWLPAARNEAQVESGRVGGGIGSAQG